MSLPKHTLESFSHYLELFLMTCVDETIVPEDVQAAITQARNKIDTGDITELEFENIINSMILQLNEHMFVWKLVANARASQFLQRGASFLVMVTAPDLQTCVQDIAKYKRLILPESYQITFRIEQGKVLFTVTHQGFDSPLPHIKDDTAIGLALFIFRELVGHTFDYDAIYIPDDRPHFDKSYVQAVTKATIYRHKGPMIATFAEAALQRKNRFYDENVRNSVMVQLENLVKEFQPSQTLTHQVAELIRSDERPASVTLELVAQQLRKSPSTLRRHLADENSSFKFLQSKVLDELCVTELLGNDNKIDSLALRLGYSERATFERSFKKKFHTTPAKFREIRNRILGLEATAQASDLHNLQLLIGTLAPLPDSCLELINPAKANMLDLPKVVAIVSRDPIFSGRVMGVASKAIYGRAPKDLQQAIGINLGIETVKNLAVLYTAQDQLSQNIRDMDVELFIEQVMLVPAIFRHLVQHQSLPKYDSATINQALMFGLLGMLLLFHKEYGQQKQMLALQQQSATLYDFNQQLQSNFSLSIFSISGLLLSYWGLDSDIIKVVMQLEDEKQPERLQQLMLFSFAFSQTLFVTQEKESLEDVAQQLGITNLTQLREHIASSPGK